MFVSMSHIFIFIYCYVFYFDLIGYTLFQFLIRFFFFFFTFTNQNFNIMYAVSFIYLNSSSRCFSFCPFGASFSLSNKNGIFSPLPPSTIVFFVKLVDFFITHECDHSFVSLLPSEIQSKAFVFSPFGGCTGGSGPWGGLPEWEYKIDRHSSSITRPQGATCNEYCSTNAPKYMRPTPKPPQIRGC